MNVRLQHLILLLVVLFIMPWYEFTDGFFNFSWWSLGYFFAEESAPLYFQMISHEKVWLYLVSGPYVLLALANAFTRKLRSDYEANIHLGLAALGLLALMMQGMLINDFGPVFLALNAFLPIDAYQIGMGYGALLLSVIYIYYVASAFAHKGMMKGDLFSTYALFLIVFLVSVFVIFPVLNILSRAFLDSDTGYSITVFSERIFNSNIWGLGCIGIGSGYCGVATATAFLAVMTGLSTTTLGLCFALVITRTDFKWRGRLKALSLLPIITPPFVVGMALIMLLGRSGIVTKFIESTFGIELGGWIYGFWGLWIAQTLAYTPIAFMVLIGVVQGVGPSYEEASTTLNATPFRTFRFVTLPLIRPGLANAFLLGFVESMADLGNALLIGGDFPVLSAQIFYAVAGASSSTGKAAALVVSLLVFTITAFLIQRYWVGRKTYATVTGKGDGGSNQSLPKWVKNVSVSVALFWSVFTVSIYVLILMSGFVETWGSDYSLTFKHYITAFDFNIVNSHLIATGVAWDSLITTLWLALLAMPLTTAMGLATGYLLTRQNFAFKSAFEFSTMLSFAIPGIVIGFSYVVAFNQAPIDLTYTGIIIVVCFMFRNMPVGVRSSIAALKQLDPGLDEASFTLGASNLRSIRTVILPLIKPAVFSALVYSFIRSITSVSAVIFLVSADYNLASAYIIGLVENNQFGVPIAYSTTLIAIMGIAIFGLNQLVGKRTLFKPLTNGAS